MAKDKTIAYKLTMEDIDKTTSLEVAFGTTRCLPPEETIPEEFKHFPGNIYCRLVDALFIGEPIPKGNISFNPGFEDVAHDVKQLNKFIKAHLTSFQPKHEHKIAGVSYMVSLIMTIEEDK